MYWIDPGLVRAVKKQLGTVVAEERGVLLEGWVLTFLRSHAEEAELYDDIFYWAPAQARLTEVDFLLKRGRDFIAIEVKSQKRYSQSLLSGLRAIGDLPELVRRILVYGGTRRLRTSDDIEVWPVDTLVRAVERGRLWL